MVAILTTVLTLAAELSNLFSAAGVLVCFVCMVIFILRLQGEDVFRTSVVHVTQPVARVAYQKVHVPFSLHLHNPREATYSDVQLKVQSDVNYSVHSFWGVPDLPLHSVMTSPWPVFLTTLLGGTQEEKEEEEEKKQKEEGREGRRVEELEDLGETEVIEKMPSEIQDEVAREAGGERVVHVGLSDHHPPRTVGSAPRRVYPLVVCLTRQDHPGEGDDLTGVGALINVIHIKDSNCPMPSCVLHQYLKQYSGQLTKLQALYTQGGTSSEGTTDTRPTYGDRESEQQGEGRGEEKEEDSKEEEEEEEDEELIPLEEACVVCQTKRTTRALLPCRHVCTCDTCFPRLTNCPMCRAAIRAYFLVGQESTAAGDRETLDDGTEEALNMSLWRRIGTTLASLVRGDVHLFLRG